MEMTIPRLLKEKAEQYPEYAAQYSKDKDDIFQPTTYKELYKEVEYFSLGLLSFGINRGDHVGLISDNRKEWLIADLAIISIGAADVPRGCDSTADEVKYIISFSGCKTVIVENETQLNKLESVKSDLPDLKQYIVLDADYKKKKSQQNTNVLTYDEIIQSGKVKSKESPALYSEEINKGKRDDLVTIIFTSGTTGEPKGVMLSHGNFLHQVDHSNKLITILPGDKWICVLPVWHSFERIMQYIALGTASSLGYSKPIPQIMLADFLKIKPTWMASVPRIWESVLTKVYRNVNTAGGIKKVMFYFFVGIGSLHSTFTNMIKNQMPQFKKRSAILDFICAIIPFILLFPLRLLGNLLVFSKIKAMLGGKFVAGISGGGGLPPNVDKFFQAAGILLLEGYGLTESAPVLSLRPQHHPVPGTIGPIFPGTQFKILDENGKTLLPGMQGVLYAKGPQIMLGYYNKKEETKKILSEDGWLNTGDLAMQTWRGEIKIVGREKDTIVLMGGENIEPLPIEAKLQESPYIGRAVVVGQDKKNICALIITDIENLKLFAEQKGIPFSDEVSLQSSDDVNSLIKTEINNYVSLNTGFKGFERISRFVILKKDFIVGVELSAKQEIKRHIINEMYKKEIEGLFT